MRHLYHRGKGGVKIETMHPTAVMTHGMLIGWICKIGAAPLLLVNHNMPPPPVFSDVWQGKELRAHFADVWQ